MNIFHSEKYNEHKLLPLLLVCGFTKYTDHTIKSVIILKDLKKYKFYII